MRRKGLILACLLLAFATSRLALATNTYVLIQMETSSAVSVDGGAEGMLIGKPAGVSRNFTNNGSGNCASSSYINTGSADGLSVVTIKSPQPAAKFVNLFAYNNTSINRGANFTSFEDTGTSCWQNDLGTTNYFRRYSAHY